MSAASLEGVTFHYAGSDAPALRDVSVIFEAGQVAWLFGELGAGCSTLLLVAAGLAPRYTGGTLNGRVRLIGVDPGALTARAAIAGRIGYVTSVPAMQLSGVADTVWEEVAFAPANLGWPLDKIRSAAIDALARLEAAHLWDRNPTTLSGGELQRVVLAGMLALDPPVWLLDEPASALDAAGRHLLGKILRAEAAAGKTVVIASEEADELVGLADRAVVLRRGVLALDGPPRELLASEDVWRIGAGSTSVAALAREARHQAASALLEPPYPVTVDDGVARWRT